MKQMSEWEKAVRIELINRGMKINDLAAAIGKSVSHVGPVINGRVIAPPTHYAISEYLGIDDPENADASTASA